MTDRELHTILDRAAGGARITPEEALAMLMGSGESNAERVEHLAMIRAAQHRVSAQRDTTYHHLKVHWTPADDPRDERVVSHLSSTALDGTAAGGPAAGRRGLPLVETR